MLRPALTVVTRIPQSATQDEQGEGDREERQSSISSGDSSSSRGPSTTASSSLLTSSTISAGSTASSSTTPTQLSAHHHHKQQQQQSKKASAPTPSPSHTGSNVDSWGANFWCIVTDPFSASSTFFANPTTGECRWTLPKGTIVLPPNPEGEWWELIDESTGREYYWHTQRRESSWTRPESATGLVVIPMSAVQGSAHSKEGKGKGERRSASEELKLRAEPSSVVMLDSERGRKSGEDPGAIVTTPLGPRPRTKSLPRSQHGARLRFHDTPLYQHHRPQRYETPQERQAEKGECDYGQDRDGDADLAQKARRSIVMRDQQALKLAREASTPPFRTELLPPHLYSSAMPHKMKRRVRSATTIERGSPARPKWAT